MDLGLKDRVVLVTGSSRGIGRATAVRFGQEGARVAITYRSDRAAANATAAAVSGAGGEPLVVALDLGSMVSIAAARDAVFARWARIDVLVNNALLEPQGPLAPPVRFEDVPPERWTQLLRVNLEGPYAMIQAVVPAMRTSRWGRIVNISSIWAADGFPGYGWYCAAKAALHGLTFSLAKELGPAGILVNGVMPGLTATEAVLETYPRSLRDRIGSELPIRRLPKPAEVASLVAYLGSTANTAVTGEIVRASGGRP